MDTDKAEVEETGTTGGVNQKGSDDEESCEEVIMETSEEVEVVGEKVKVAVSHEKVAEYLRSLEKTTMKVHTQAQDGGGPRNINNKALKDVTNRVQVKPTIAKASRSISKPTGAQQNNKQVKILKRVGEGISGPPNKSPFEFSASNQNNRGDGSGEGRPPDPPDIYMSTEESPTASAPNREFPSDEQNTRIRADGDLQQGEEMATKERSGAA